MTLNPLFAVELRGRFRRLAAFAQLAGAVVAAALLLGFLLQFHAGREMSTVAQARAQGRAMLDAYQGWGGLLIFFTGALVGAMSLIHEKNAGTFEQLLLCPIGAIGIARGKIASALAFSLLLQLALLPLLIVTSSSCLLTPGQVLCVMALHFGLCAQGVTLGILGAVRARTIISALGLALGWWISVLLWLFVLVIIVAVIFTIINAVVAGVGVFFTLAGHYYLQFGWQWIITHVLLPLGVGLAALAGGAMGAPALVRLGALTPLIFAGQMLSLFCYARWAAWQLHSPDRMMMNVIGSTDKTPRGAAQVPALFFLTHWKWQLTPFQIARFPLSESEGTRVSRPKPAAKPATKNARRIRLLKARWLQNVNPVLWLDLQRCLSLRAPNPNAQLPLLLFAALGGSISLAVLMTGLVTLLTGGASEASLGQFLSFSHYALCYGALASGPILGATGYVIERQSMMLHELRLTLLSARGLWLGKFGARYSIPIVAAIPMLLLFQFFAQNMGEATPRAALLSEFLLTTSIAACSISTCLWLSYHAPHQLAAALWCLGWAAIWGSALWHGASGIWVWASPFAGGPLSCALFHGAIAVAASGAIYWKLRRMGFG